MHSQRTCCLSIEGYIAYQLLKYGHKASAKPQLSPHRHSKLNYGSKEQLVAKEDTSPKLDNEGIKHVQAIVGALCYYARAFHNILILCLSAIGAKQASVTEQTVEAIDQILEHVATYPNYGITYQVSDMILSSDSDAELNNESKARSCARAHIFFIRKRPNARVERSCPHDFPNHQVCNVFSS